MSENAILSVSSEAVSREEKKIEPENGSGRAPLRVSVGIATSGRPGILAETLRDLLAQSRSPWEVLVLYGEDSDITDLPPRFPGVRFLRGSGGLCAKRNRILDEISDENSGELRGGGAPELVFFMDDDFLLDREYLRVTAEAFERDGGLVAATGWVLADGAKGPGLRVDEGRKVLLEASGEERPALPPRAAFNTYGCNMAFRLHTVREHGLRFDERLPAYGWYEDIDFSRRLLPHGLVALLPGALGVHLGAKVGRVSGRKLGYSQVANPVYLWRKGSFPFGNTVRSVARNFLSNLIRSIRPEAYVDRRGRLRGNMLAFRDLLRGRVDPDRIAYLG